MKRTCQIFASHLSTHSCMFYNEPTRLISEVCISKLTNRAAALSAAQNNQSAIKRGGNALTAAEFASLRREKNLARSLSRARCCSTFA
jgi:hypothetical protein